MGLLDDFAEWQKRERAAWDASRSVMPEVRRQGSKEALDAWGNVAGLLGSLTKFQKAYQLAQKNAALPVEQGGLGLPPDNTAAQRAKALGFDTDVYHGTHSRPIGAGNETPDIKEFVPSVSFGSTDPAVFVTRDKGMANAFARNYVDNTGAIYPLKVRTNAGQITETADHARNNEMLVHNPALLRSRFAAFDPKKRNSRDLLASLGLLGLLGAGTYGSEE